MNYTATVQEIIMATAFRRGLMQGWCRVKVAGAREAPSTRD